VSGAVSRAHWNETPTSEDVNWKDALVLLEDEAGTLREHWLEPGEARHIPVGRLHRMIAVEDCDIIEVSTPELDDVVRVDDAYGRAVAAETRS